MRNSIFDDKTVGMMHEYIHRRREGKLSDEDYEGFVETIKTLVRSSNIVNCQICLDQNWYYPTAKSSEMVECPSCQPRKDWPKSNGPIYR
jgi:hypothetical protein